MYKFTTHQLNELLVQTIDLYQEYIDRHGRAKLSARWSAVEDTLEGLYAEQELYRQGEIKTPGQVIE